MDKFKVFVVIKCYKHTLLAFFLVCITYSASNISYSCCTWERWDVVLYNGDTTKVRCRL